MGFKSFVHKYKTPLIIGGLALTGGAAGAYLGAGTKLGAGMGALAGAGIGSSIGSGYSMWENQRYERGVQNQIFAREDTALTRQINDLRANGLSPVLAAGGSGFDAGSIVNSNAPQMSINALETMALLKQETDMSYTNEQTKLAQLQQLNAYQDFQNKQSEYNKINADVVGKEIQNAYDMLDLMKYRKTGISKNGSSALGKIFGDAFESSTNQNVQSSMEKMINKIFPYTDVQKFAKPQEGKK